MKSDIDKHAYSETNIIYYPDEPSFLSEYHPDRLPNIRKSWSYSKKQLRALNSHLNNAFHGETKFSVVVAGSYGRMDANEKSDLDFFIVHDKRNGVDLENEEQKIAIVRKIAQELSISMPSSGGAFSSVIDLSYLLSTAGSRDDTLNQLARRLLLLMECRPVYNSSLFNNTIINGLLDHYMIRPSRDPDKDPVLLLNDLIHYFRAICVNVEFSFWNANEKEKQGLRNIKLRHSRVLIYAGLLLLILNVSTHKNEKENYLRKYIQSTPKSACSPLERIYHVYKDNSDYNFSRIAESYDLFLSKLQDDNVRNELGNLDYGDRYKSRYYTELRLNSQFLISELTRFVFANKHKWNPQIIEYLIF